MIIHDFSQQRDPLVDTVILKKITEYEAVLRTVAQGGGTVEQNAKIAKDVLTQFNVPLKHTLY